MNWGQSIIVVFVLFAIGMLTLVTKSMLTRIEMVNNDYYAAELQYQQLIDDQSNVRQLSAPVQIRQPGDSVLLFFPQELHGRPIQGDVLFYRPSDSRKDFTMPLQLNGSGMLAVSRQRFIKGNYRVKLHWEVNGKTYFQELQHYVQ